MLIGLIGKLGQTSSALAWSSVERSDRADNLSNILFKIIGHLMNGFLAFDGGNFLLFFLLLLHGIHFNDIRAEDVERLYNTPQPDGAT